jgi:hypothetical protein
MRFINILMIAMRQALWLRAGLPQLPNSVLTPRPGYTSLEGHLYNSTSPTLQKLYPHQEHRVSVQYLFEPDW